MNDTSATVTVRVHSAIAEIPAADWDACAGEANPTVSHAFLNAMEESGSTTARTGWMPQHLSLAGSGGELAGVVPLYAKSHSYGEYIFDYGWADAYERAGRRYYPKLLSAVPFTPVPGPRLLVRPGAPAEAREHLLAG
ncbi:MAG: N-acetyltransferase, partial [Alphaproteobacteria bacterium]|nr:N-acetyltransferase [Alphaproteobacteria bacterium]